MSTLPLHFQAGHLYFEIEGEWWLVDTGAPTGFGTRSTVSIAGRQFRLADNYLGLDAESLAGHVGVECAGLLGADVLGDFDILFNEPGHVATLSRGSLELPGTAVPLELFMGIPIVTAEIAGQPCRMFLDTGAQLSYWQDPALATFPSAGAVEDFYPMVGKFKTESYYIDQSLAGEAMTLRCGRLPDPLGLTLMMAGTRGILGNELLMGRKACYRPRSGVLVMQTREHL